jgi:hypothetical protein
VRMARTGFDNGLHALASLGLEIGRIVMRRNNCFIKSGLTSVLSVAGYFFSSGSSTNFTFVRSIILVPRFGGNI